MTEKVLIATYGSLRLGMGNFPVNNYGDGKVFGRGKTKDNFDIFEYGGGGFPSVSLVHSDSETQVVVDVFEAPVSGFLGAYDSLEGHHPDRPMYNFYDRSEVTIVMDGGEEVTAWIYHIDQPQRVVVPGGDWCVHKRGEDFYENFLPQWLETTPHTVEYAGEEEE